MLLVIIAAIFLGSFALLFSVWLIVWSWVMSPMQNTTSKLRNHKVREILN